MRVLFLASRLDRPSASYRALSYLPLFEREGVHARALAMRSRGSLGEEALAGAAGADVVVLMRALLEPRALNELRSAARVLVYDFDDAVMLRESSRAWRWSLRRLRAFARTVRIADAVHAGNETLRRWAGAFGAWDRTVVLPTPVGREVLALPPLKPRPAGAPVVLGWVGSRGTLPYLDIARPALRRVLSRNPRARLRVICDRFPHWPEIPMERVRWEAGEEPRYFAGMDIGLMPLPGDLWARGKGAYKLWQYLGAGRPAVVSPVGEAGRVARECPAALAADTPRRWAETLETLIRDPARREAMGAQGRAYAAAHVNREDSFRFLMRRLRMARGPEEPEA